MDGRGARSRRSAALPDRLNNMTSEKNNQTNYEVIAPENGMPIKAWIKGVQLEDQARKQLLNVAQLPFIFKWIAAMPDVHWGVGATVGSVIPTKGAIIPAAVGVDIGCGMIAAKINLKASQLPDNLSAIRSGIEVRIPHGRTDNGRENDKGSWKITPDIVDEGYGHLHKRLTEIVQQY